MITPYISSSRLCLFIFFFIVWFICFFLCYSFQDALSSRKAFVRYISHEVRTPLNIGNNNPDHYISVFLSSNHFLNVRVDQFGWNFVFFFIYFSYHSFGRFISYLSVIYFYILSHIYFLVCIFEFINTDTEAELCLHYLFFLIFIYFFVLI